MNRRARRLVSAGVRLLIVGVAVWWLARSSAWDWTKLHEIIASADRRLLAAGLLTFGPAPVLIAFRLRWLLAVHDVHLSRREAIRVTFGANFLISALPVGTSGGDTAKAIYIASHTPHKHEAVMTVLFDRLVGVISLVLMAGTTIILNWDNPALARQGQAIGIISLAFLAGAIAYFSPRLRAVLRLDEILAKLPLGQHIGRMDRAVLAFRSRGRRVASALAITLVLQVISILSLYLMGWGLGLVGESPLRALPVYLAYTPICFLTGALPVGVMEVTFEELFVSTAGLGPPGSGMLLSLLNRFMQLAWALPGAIVVLRGGYRYSPEAMQEVQAELDQPLVPSPAAPSHP